MHHFVVSVRTWCSRSDELVFHIGKARKESLIGLCIKLAQYRRFIKRGSDKVVWINPHTILTITYTLVVSNEHVTLIKISLNFLHSPDVNDIHIKPFLRLSNELYDYSTRTNHQALTALMGYNKSQYFQLSNGFLHTE